MLAVPNDWRLAAVRIGRSLDRRAGLLVGGEDVERCVELAYFLWCVRSADGTVVVIDAGFTDRAACDHTIVDYVSPQDALDELGIDAAMVKTVVITHLHWDHMGGFESFPSARFLVARSEWDWTIGRLGDTSRMLDETYDRAGLREIATLHPSRVELVEDGHTPVPGCRLEVVGGHTPGHTVVRVSTRNGDVALLGDLAYLSANVSLEVAPMICFDRWRTRDLYGSYRSESLRLVPGHDPAVLDMLDERLSPTIAIIK
ncbi:N-acyl homoserine lactonase AiiA [Mycolicibacterium vanbaalenii]|uniref:N-acyl homoserine lactonase AiiA n=1 Tax=Mycolicibacterium vanbaalenii TaxID=110539 RepID=A0A5S9RB49_MYCVN|nr:N-acyl homoserine lactonase AiiA [Mycolicibacterium vanbaalenii]